ncbi:MAG: SDR family NAD(P)-dependent oxidoreductase [Propylenella sp.]
MLKELSGKTAVITGGAGGIGRGIATAVAAEGVNVALVDIDGAALDVAVHEIAWRSNVKVRGFRCDVSERPAVYRLADDIEREMGNIHILCNNAGVSRPGVELDQLADDDFDWIMGVNLFGVQNCLRAFLPKIRGHGEGGHIVNTASIGGLRISRGTLNAAYGASKMATVSLSVSLEELLEGSGIGVSVLCPQATNTNINTTTRVRPERFGGPDDRDLHPEFTETLRHGLSGEDVGRFVLHALKHGEFFVLSHPHVRAEVEEWHKRVLDGFDRAEMTAKELDLRVRPTPAPGKR